MNIPIAISSVMVENDTLKDANKRLRAKEREQRTEIERLKVALSDAIRIYTMSVYTCDKCGDAIDSDFDPDCFVEDSGNPAFGSWKIVCESCRDDIEEIERTFSA